ncbi:MAG TPA: FKBP-type peptidyl-prolyl cis-trans isomerase [Chitinophagales bacterium]|nr:FKBP-type peptidyl-prolyl cis-trans isomerase [Chitinophagales bacterium]HRK27930.1 FKBP-type peptidyl-prolyl cis-trans isomerase [Chitinophagales bacterium]
MKHLTFLSFIALLFILSTASPALAQKNQKGKEQAQKDDKLIKKYLKQNKLTKKFTKTQSGLYYHIEQKGQGKPADDKSRLKVHYKGTLLNGTVFDSSYDRGKPIEFTVNMVVKGWREGLMFFNEGTKGTLLIPSELAYGERAMGDKIQPNSVLRFDMELLEVLPNTPPNEQNSAITISREQEENNIKAYLEKEGLIEKAQKTESGVYYIIETKGNGNHPTLASTVKVHYKGTLLNGTVFDSSYDRNQPISFPLQGVIKGWQDGIPKLSEGGKGTLVIPSQLAYGARAVSSIPANSILRFDVELLEVQTNK